MHNLDLHMYPWRGEGAAMLGVLCFAQGHTLYLFQSGLEPVTLWFQSQFPSDGSS